MLWRPGDWAWSREYREPVRIIEAVNLWDQTVYRVWVPGRDSIVRLSGNELSPITRSEGYSRERLIYTVSAARSAESLAQPDVLLAPLEGSVTLLPHQIYALSRAISGNRVRFLLADEVGLGKTIEAGLIMRELKLRGLVRRTLVVAPRGLVTQWVQEMETRFRERFHLIMPAEVTALSYLEGDANVWRRFDQVVVPMDAVKPVQSRRGWTSEQVSRYNRERFENLISAGWDLIIVDEAHRIAGSTDTVARYRLGEGLAEAAPYLLLLTATPHQGKTEAFYRLVALLDKEAFPNIDSVKRERVAPYVIRTEKRKAVDARGNPLFKPRITLLIPVGWQARHQKQRELYEAVTEYVRHGYNQALKEKRNYIGFLMVLMQRLVASSTRAIRTALERRLEIIEQEVPLQFLNNEEMEPGEDWWDLDGQEQLEQILKKRLLAFANEREEVNRLLSLARQCEALQPDARAEELLEWLYRLQAEENNPELKFLIFTEFIPTQEMLKEFLEQRGFSVVSLNGSMGLEERRRVQQEFAGPARVLISTDAGGEGLNLQFCHVVINYDLPWNPMRLEQRIGRVDRIGQKYPVRALNFILQNTVEFRVQEVLEEKLATILAEFGVDKMGDVLDSAEVAAEFENLYKEAILNPEEVQAHIERLGASLRERVLEITAATQLLGQEEQIDAGLAEKISEHPLPYWVERMVINFLQGEGGTVKRKLVGYDLTWPDGSVMNNVVFSRQEAENYHMSYLSLEEPRVRGLVNRLPRVVAGQPIPRIRLKGLSHEICGYWSLWRISLLAGSMRNIRILPLFQHKDGRVLLPTARRIWDMLLSEQTSIGMDGTIQGEKSREIFAELEELAVNYGQNHYLELKSKYQELLQKEREKGLYAFRARREAIMRIGLPAVRQHRLAELECEERDWTLRLQERERVLPELSAVTIVYVEGE
ncbi:superfamily II DNA or RNA helicase [Desulfofundulus luciae]|uniref:Superfamily II DNA or RNA helicase n=1 Tax=Desulfofundulus luciae TaxID=74702 RepID=A0ABU0B3B6_9FIRM|nr:helicase-related protein [Desulfofundulus luciae]MDQ0286779.1 superfamily II DNA or RNA helicase [Desulfofundulus luciae]